MKTCNLLVVRANNIRRLEFWFEILEISLIDGIAGRISHICSYDLWDRFRCWRIDVLGTKEIRPGFCLSCRIRKSRMYGGMSVSTGKLSQISRQRGRSTKRRMFIASDRAGGYFVSSPLSGTVWFCSGRCSEKHGFGD